MTSHGKWTPGDLISMEDRNAEHAALVALLARHAISVQMIRVDAGVKALKVPDVAEFLAQMEQLARALRRHVEQPLPAEEPTDEALAATAKAALPEADDAACPVKRTKARTYGKPGVALGYFSNSGAGSPPPPVDPVIGDRR